MALNFPNSPTINDLYTLGTRTWIWDGTAWNIQGLTAASTTYVKTLTVINPSASAINISLFYASKAGTMTNLTAKRTGGSGAVVNARKNGTSTLRSSDLSLTGTSWTDGGALQNATFIATDYWEIQIISTAGSPTELSVQLTFTQIG